MEKEGLSMAPRRASRRAEESGETSNADLDDLLHNPGSGPSGPTHLGNFENHRLHSQSAGIGERDELKPPAEHPSDDREDLQAGEESEAGEEGDADLEADEAGDDLSLDDGREPDSDSPPGVEGGLAALRQEYDAKIDRLLARFESQERELQFLRQGAASTAQGPTGGQPHPLASVPLPFEVREEDVKVLMEGGPQAVQVLNRALQLTAASTAQHTAGVLARAYEQNEAAKSSGNDAVQQFYADNPDLRPYVEVLQAQANQIWQEMPYASTETKMRELGPRARERLRGLGISLPTRDKAGRARSRQRRGAAREEDTGRREGRIRPAHAEMGGRGRANGSTRLTPLQREMYELID